MAVLIQALWWNTIVWYCCCFLRATGPDLPLKASPGSRVVVVILLGFPNRISKSVYFSDPREQAIPLWQVKHSRGGGIRSSVETSIMALFVPGCLCVLEGRKPHLPEAYEILRMNGFARCLGFCWIVSWRQTRDESKTGPMCKLAKKNPTVCVYLFGCSSGERCLMACFPQHSCRVIY